MKFTDQIKKQIVKGLLDVIQRLSDLDFQKRIWIKGIGPECDSFDDAVCDFIDPASDIIKNYKEFGLSEEQHQILANFFNIFEKFADENDFPELFMNAPEWLYVVDEAKKVLKAFDYKKT